MSGNVEFESIDKHFSKGKYLGIEIIFMKKNNYVNASKIVLQHNKRIDKLIQDGKTPFENKKKFNSWKEQEGVIRYIKYLSNKLNIDAEDFIENPENLPNNLSGSYIHKFLLVDFVGWLSNDMKYDIRKIVDEYNDKQNLKEKNKLIKEKDDKIDNLQSIIERLESKIESSNKETNKQFEKTNKKIDLFTKENKKLHKKSQSQLKQIKYACKDRVTSPSNNKHDNIFAIFKKNMDIDDKFIYKNKNGKKIKVINPDYYEYIVVRTKRCNYNSRKKQLKEEYENLELILYLEDIPNANKFYHYATEKLSEYMDVFGLHFNIDYNYEEDKVIDKFKLAHKDRYDIPDFYDENSEDEFDNDE